MSDVQDSIGTSINIRDINTYISRLYRNYIVSIDRILGTGLIGNNQIRNVYDSTTNGRKEYSKGHIFFKNSIDELNFLIDHREDVAKIIGIPSEEIYGNRRDLAKVRQYMSLVRNSFEIGDIDKGMQLYISKKDNNTSSLDIAFDWQSYILTQEWIDELKKWVVDDQIDYEQQQSSYPTISYISDSIQELLKDHEEDYHSSMESFDADEYMDDPKPDDDYANAVNKLLAFRKLNYSFYEIYKPIRKTDRYVKVNLFVDGTIEISGTVDLQDCQKVEWEYGSMEYLRSLNTNNKKYLFLLSRQYCDLTEDNPFGSDIWWKPDSPSPIEKSEDDEEEEDEEDKQYIYYKPYESERMLRWYGTTYIPLIDENSIQKCTICSAPAGNFLQDATSFHTDSSNIAANGKDLTRYNIDNTTSQSLLNLFPQATIEVKTLEDGQYLQFIVNGKNQQTTAVSFHIRAKISNVIQEMNHYQNTWKLLQECHDKLLKTNLFLQNTIYMYPQVKQIWDSEKGDVPFIEDELTEILDDLYMNSNYIDLLRLRQIDLDAVLEHIENYHNDRKNYIETLKYPRKKTEQEVYDGNLYDYINDFNQADSTASELGDTSKLDELYSKINCDQKDNNIRNPLNEVYGTYPEYLTESQIQKLEERNQRYAIGYDDMTPYELRYRIETYNNLIVRLPVSTDHNKMASKRIFQDWKAFVDGAKDYLEKNNLIKIDSEESRGLGTDMKPHYFNECHIIDENDSSKSELLVDYSYIYDEYPYQPKLDDDTGLPVADRWDYWSESDFD